MDPIQEVIEIETGDGQAAVTALSEIVAGLREELEETRAEMDGLAEGTDGAGESASSAGGSVKGLSGGVSGLARAISTVNPEIGSMVMTFVTLKVAVPKLAAALKALPAAMGPMGIAALALALAFVKITKVTRELGEELDELDRKLEEHGKQLNTAAQIGDELDAVNKRITDELSVLNGEFTEADIKIADFNRRIDEMTERQIRLIGVEGESADAIRKHNQAIKDRNTELIRGKEAVKDAIEGARQQALAEQDAAEASKMRAAAAKEAEEAQAAALAEQLAEQEAAMAIQRFKVMEEELTALGAGLVAQLEEVDWSALGDEIERAGERAARQIRAVEITQGVGDVLATGGDPLALLGMIPGVGGAIAGGLGGLASLGGKSDEQLEAMFGGLADAILAGLERLPDILGPLVVDFALALVLNLPRALAEAIGGLVSELFAMIFPNRGTRDTGKEFSASQEAAILAAHQAEMEQREEMQSAASAFRAASTPSLTTTNATPALAAALAGRNPRRGRMSVELRQPGIFGTAQQIDLATGPGGLRERA